jgi:hypothetical protein
MGGFLKLVASYVLKNEECFFCKLLDKPKNSNKLCVIIEKGSKQRQGYD